MAIRAAVIGAGAISAQHLLFLRRRGDVRVVGVCDLSRAMARFACERFGAERAFTDHRRMLDKARPEVVHVLTPAATHAAIAADCLDAGAHLVVEKPVAPSRAEFHRLWALARGRGRLLVEDQNYRFNAPWLAIERLVGDSRLGEVREVEVRLSLDLRDPGSPFADRNLPHPSHRLPAGALHDFVSHPCYLAPRVLPLADGPDLVRAVWSNHGGDGLFRYDDLDALVVAGGRHLRVRLECRNRPQCFTVFVRGDRGYAEADMFQPYLRAVLPRPGPKQLASIVNHAANGLGFCASAVVNFKRKLLQEIPFDGLRGLLARTYRAVAQGGVPPLSFDDMDRPLALIERLLADAGPARP